MIIASLVREDAAGEPFPCGDQVFLVLPRVGETIVVSHAAGSERHVVMSVAHFPSQLEYGADKPAEVPRVQIVTRFADTN